jgi:hypothetical protein
MDDFQREGISHETGFFLTRSKWNIFFLLAHVMPFCGILWERYRNKFFVKLRGHHLGSKSTPFWLKEFKISDQNLRYDFSELASRIPNISRPVLKKNPRNENTPYDIAHDPENYLAQHRWGFLFDEILAQQCEQLPENIWQFLDAVPDKNDAAWETYSTCERIANLLIWLSSVSYNQRAELLSALIPFLEDSLSWVSTHLEYYGKKTGNHLLNNARVLIMAGCVLGNQRAIATGMQILERMLPVLILPDGSLRERSSHYQLIVLTWLLDVHSFLKASEMYSAEKLDFLKKFIRQMRDTASLFCDGAGYMQVFIGDISPDCTPIKTVQKLLICYPEWWPSPCSKTNTTARDDWRYLQTEKSKVILNIPQGRYPQKFSSHGHNDITSFVWVYNDELILIDSGRARYTKDAISTRQKSARGHSLALVDGFAPFCESLVVNGNWWPTPYASAWVDVKSDAKSLTVTHNGYRRATAVKNHTRKLILDENALKVYDIFTGKGHVKIDLLWQLSPKFKFTAKDKLSAHTNHCELEIDLSALPAEKEINVSDNDGNNWYSDQYGYAQPNFALIISCRVKLPFESLVIFKVKPCVV